MKILRILLVSSKIKSIGMIALLILFNFQLSAAENEIQNIDKETFCSEATQKTEKEECYEIKKYIDTYLMNGWFGVYSAEGEKSGDLHFGSKIENYDSKNYYVWKSEYNITGYFDPDSDDFGEENAFEEMYFEAFYPFNLEYGISTTKDSYGNNLKITIEYSNNQFVIEKIKGHQVNTNSFDSAGYNLFDFIDEPLLKKEYQDIGDTYEFLDLSYDRFEEGKIFFKEKLKIINIEDKNINGDIVKIYTEEYYYENEDGVLELWGEMDADKNLNIYEMRFGENGYLINEPMNVARELHYGGETYLGDHEAGLPHGLGIMKSEESIYIGEWVKGLKHGNGRLEQRDEFGFGMYEGEWADDQPHGKGKIVYSDGSSDTGVWEEGIKVE